MESIDCAMSMSTSHRKMEISSPQNLMKLIGKFNNRGQLEGMSNKEGRGYQIIN